jgi:alcohol dehydrogenase
MPRPVLLVLGALFGFKPMDIPGVEFAGRIEAIGEGTDGWSVGDRVAGTTTGLRFGANAEYVVVPVISKSGVLVHIPETVQSRDAAAAIVGGMTALQILHRLQPVEGRTLMVYGASGSVGSYVAQIARTIGAQVIAVCGPTSIPLVSSLGLERVLDYSRASWKREKVDILIDAVGKLSKKQITALLKPGGTWGTVKRPTKELRKELSMVMDMLAASQISPLIEKEISLDEVAENHAYVDSGRKKGNILVKVSGE